MRRSTRFPTWIWYLSGRGGLNSLNRWSMMWRHIWRMAFISRTVMIWLHQDSAVSLGCSRKARTLLSLLPAITSISGTWHFIAISSGRKSTAGGSHRWSRDTFHKLKDPSTGSTPSSPWSRVACGTERARGTTPGASMTLATLPTFVKLNKSW